MSQENLEILRRVFEEAAGGDVKRLVQSADPDIRVFPCLVQLDAAPEYRGLDGLMEYLTNWYGQWEEYEGGGRRVHRRGEHVVVVVRERGRVERTGLEVEADFTHWFVLRDGKTVEWHMYDSHTDALQAVGLRE